MRDVAHEVVFDAGHHRLEHVVALALPLRERVALAHRAQVDALAQVVHLVEVLAPVLVDDRQHDATLDLAQRLGADALFLRGVARQRVTNDELAELVDVVNLAQLLELDAGRERDQQVAVELVEIPLLGELTRAMLGDEAIGGVLDRLERLVAEVLAVEDLLAAPVDHLALLVHHLVVLEDVLADLEVAVLDGALRALDRLRDHLRLERHVVGEGAVHDPAHRAGREEPHELVFERQVEAALPGSP